MRINGFPVVDATKPIRLHITAGDVARGANKDPGACAAARTCLRQIPDVSAARVHIGRTYLQIGRKWVRFKTSAALRSEIVAFDRGGKFEPGEYLINPLSASDLPSGRRQGSKKDRRKKGAKKRVRHTTTNVRAHGANR